MTITDTATKFRYLGNASTDTFAFSGKAFTAADLVVQIITRATDVLEETLTITTDYSVTILSDGTASIVTVVGKIPSALQDIQILRNLAQTQTTSLPVGTKFPAKLVENSLDRAVGLSQDIEESVTRSLKFPSTSSTTVATLPEPVDDTVLLFDGVTGLFKNGPTAAAISGAEASATAAASSASAASTSETNAASSATDAANSAAGVNLPSITVTDTGSILQVNAAGTAYEILTAGAAGKTLTSNGPDAALTYEDNLSELNNGYVTNNYNFGGFGILSGNALASVDTLYCIPFSVGAETTFTRIAVEVTSTGTATLARLGIYNLVDGKPTSIVLDAGTISVAGTGEKEITISQSLDAGIYMLAIVANGSFNWSLFAPQDQLVAHALGKENTTSSVDGLLGAFTFGVLTSSPSVSSQTSGFPALWLRKV